MREETPISLQGLLVTDNTLSNRWLLLGHGHISYHGPVPMKVGVERKIYKAKQHSREDQCKQERELSAYFLEGAMTCTPGLC